MRLRPQELVAGEVAWFYDQLGIDDTYFASESVDEICDHIIALYGAPRTLRYFAVAMAAMLLPVLPYIKGRLPARVYGPAPRSSNRDWLRNPSFWLYTVVNLIQGFAYFMPIVWLPSECGQDNLWRDG